MGKHTRAYKAELERKEKLQRRIRYAGGALVGTVAIAATFLLTRDTDNAATDVRVPYTADTGFQPGPVPVEVLDASQRYVDTYGCKDQEKLTFAVEEDLDNSPLTEPLGSTLDNHIALSTEVRNMDYLQSAAIHETGHACTKGLVLFDVPYEGVDQTSYIPILGADGFKFYLADDTYTTEMEEGVVEWLSQAIEGYIPSSDIGYQAVSGLMGEIASQRSLSRELLSELHQNSDLIAFVALAKNKPVDEISSYDITDLILLFQNAFYEGVTPSSEDVSFVLNYNTGFSG